MSDPESVALRLEFKADQALKAEPDPDWTEVEKREFRIRKQGRASAFAEAARIVRGQD